MPGCCQWDLKFHRCTYERQFPFQHNLGVKCSIFIVLVSFFALDYMQVNVADKEHAKYLENHVPNYIWKVKPKFRWRYSMCHFPRLLV